MDVSVLLATRDRSALLHATLQRLAQQQLGGIAWELIVVDNGSSDDTTAVLQAARRDLPLKLLREPRAGKNRALNKALEVALGELLIFTDDDVLPEESWIAELTAAARRWEDHHVFGGSIKPLFPPDTPEWIKQHEVYASTWFATFDPGQSEGPLPFPLVPFGANVAITARAIGDARFDERLGPNQTSYAMGGETEFIRRLVSPDKPPIYVPSARVQHVIQREQIEPQWLGRRNFRAGRGAARRENDTQSALLLGRPRWLWRKVLEAFAGYVLSFIGSKRQRNESAWKLHYLRGKLYEYGIMVREGRQVKHSA